jgi:hypothetical protein
VFKLDFDSICEYSGNIDDEYDFWYIIHFFFFYLFLNIVINFFIKEKGYFIAKLSFCSNFTIDHCCLSEKSSQIYTRNCGLTVKHYKKIYKFSHLSDKATLVLKKKK